MAQDKRPDLKLVTAPQKATRTKMDTLALTPLSVRGWLSPKWQRPLKINAKVLALSEQIKIDGGVLPGVLTIGIFEEKLYIVDGQHRREAFLLSEVAEGFADVRFMWFDTMGEMAAEYKLLQRSLVPMKPDDFIRASEEENIGLQTIRRRCPWVGYDMIRRNDRSPILSMSLVLRAWFCSETDVPTSSGESAEKRLERLTVEEAQKISDFLTLAFDAWGRDVEHSRLWNGLSLTLTAWLYRRTVIGQYSSTSARLTPDLFRKGLMALSADERHLDYLVNRAMGEFTRSPTYTRMKAIIAHRLEMETGNKKIKLPDPAWVLSKSDKERKIASRKL